MKCVFFEYERIVWKLFVFYLMVYSVEGFAQNQPKIQTEIDKNSIKIGEQIKYQISVETSDNEVVTFPEGQTFSPLEMVSSAAVDTFRLQEKQRLVKNYYLTQFDSGVYTIARQRIGIGNNFFMTDSLQVQVHNVIVDTLKQPLYDIKPIISVKKPASNAFWWWILIIVVLILTILGCYFLFFRKKKLSESEKIALLPAFDRAILGLKNLQNSKYLLESKHKEYYSELTDIVRRYLEEEVHISATESTTDELITKLELLLDSERLNLSKETISDFRQVLQKADLVKFAKSQPADFEAETDRRTIENVVVKTKEALPEPTQEEKMQDELYRQEMQKRQQKTRRTIFITISSCIVFIVLCIVGGWYFYKKNFIEGTSVEYLAKKEWITSSYDFPPVKITTPLVLERKEASKAFFFAKKEFVMGDIEKGFVMKLIPFNLGETAQNQNEDMYSQENVEAVVKMIEHTIENQFKAKNIFTKHEEYRSVQGIQGIKIAGTFDREVSSGKFVKIGYQNYVFAQGETFVLIAFYYPKKTEPIDQALIERILYSLRLGEE